MTQTDPVPLDYADRALRARPKRMTLLELAVIIGIIGVLVAILLPAFTHHPDRARSVQCLSNLRTLGQYMSRYVATEHAYPDRVESLFGYARQISPPPAPVSKLFCCPRSGMTPASGATTQAVRADFATGAKCAYTYLADGMPPQARSDIVLMIETAGNHNGGHTALFADGHAQLLTAEAAQRVLAQNTAGVRPIIWPPRAAAATQPVK